MYVHMLGSRCLIRLLCVCMRTLIMCEYMSKCMLTWPIVVVGFGAVCTFINFSQRYMYMHVLTHLYLFCSSTVSLYFKQKLQGLYVNASQDAKKELV